MNIARQREPRFELRPEGASPRDLEIHGRWRDHERWAITREELPR